MRLLTAASLLFALTIALPATAATHSFLVTNSGDAGAGSLRAAIQAINAHPDANPESLFLLSFGIADQTIALQSSLPGFSKSRVIVTGPGAHRLAIVGGANRRVFRNVANMAQLHISGLTLTGSVFPGGSGAGCVDAVNFMQPLGTTPDVVVRGVHFVGCLGSAGGALRAGGTLLVEDSEFRDNWSRRNMGRGGALYADFAAEVTIRRSVFVNNEVQSDSFSPTHGSARGGAVALQRAISMVARIEDSYFLDNRAMPLVIGQNTHQSRGGAIDAEYIDLTVVRSVFEGNTAGYGGAVHLGGDARPQRVENSVFVSNEATFSGGAISAFDARFSGRNNSFWMNTADQAHDLSITATGPFVISHHLHAGAASGGALCAFSGTVSPTVLFSYATHGSCNMSTQPDLGVRDLGQEWGSGPLLRLHAGSPAVGGGSLQADIAGNNDASRCALVDARFRRRPVDGNGSGTPRCDAGALEHKSFWTIFESGFE